MRFRVGPLRFNQFSSLLPTGAGWKAFVDLARSYVGPDLDYDVQLVLLPLEVPECQLSSDEDGGFRLGWNTWLRAQESEGCVEDAVFDGQEVFRL